MAAAGIAPHELRHGIPIANVDFKFFQPPGSQLTQPWALEQATGVMGATLATAATRAAMNVYLPRVGFGYDARIAAMRSVQSDIAVLIYDLPGAVERNSITPGVDADHPADLFNYVGENPPALPWNAVVAANTNAMYDAAFSGAGAGGNTRIMRIFDERHRAFLFRYYSGAACMANAHWGGAQGIEIDVMGPFPATAGTHSSDDGTTTAGPWSPVRRDTSWFTPYEWVTFCVDALAQLDHLLNAASAYPIAVFGNGIVDGWTYWDDTKGGTRRLAYASRIGHVEGFIRNKDTADTNWPTTTRTAGKNCWVDDVNMIIDAEQNNIGLVYECSLWPPAGPTTIAKSKQWHRLSLASFLLGVERWGSFSFRHDNSHQSVDVDDNPDYSVDGGISGVNAKTAVDFSMLGRHRQFARYYYSAAAPWWKTINLGRPTQTLPFVADGAPNYSGVWRRTFETGLVLCNPTGADVGGVALPAGNFTDPDLGALSGAVTVPAHDALILSAA